MRKSEQRLWDTMQENASVKKVWLQRVENIAVDGMPDVYCVGRSTATASWIELKAPAKMPKRRSTRILGTEGLLVAQVGWHLKAHSTSVPSYILIRDEMRSLYLIRGQHAESINEMSKSALRTYSLADSWPGIFEILA